MKKIKNFKLKMFALVAVLVSLIAVIGPSLLLADQKEATFSKTYGDLMYKNAFYSANDVLFARARLDQNVGYCLDIGLALPAENGGKVKLIDRKLSSITTAVLAKGYPYRNASQLGVANDNEAELATQIAVWCVVNSTNPPDSYKATQVFDINNLVYVEGRETEGKRVKDAAARLVQEAIADPYYSNPLFNIIAKDTKLVIKDDYMIAGPYVLTATGFDLSKIEVSLSNAPSSARVCDANGNEKTTFANGEGVYVKLDKSENGSKLTINAKAYGSTKVGKIYGTLQADNKQDYCTLVEEPVELDTSVDFKWDTLVGNIELYKIDQYGNKLANVTFDLKDSTGKVIATKTTDANGVIRFDNLKIGKYTLVEKSAPDGYIKVDEPLEVEVTTNSTKQVTFKNKKIGKGAIEVMKVDQYDQPVEGAKFNLLDMNGNVIYEGTSDVNGVVKFDNLEEGTYQLVETEAPKGYLRYNKPVEVKVGTNQTIKVDFPNKRVEGGIKIYKVDETNKPIEGVTFEILDANKNVIETITTNSQGYASTSVNLLLGKYYYREVSGPDYVIIDKTEHEFNVEKEAQLVQVTVTNKLAKGSLKIVKKTEDNKPLAGVEFQILDANKKVVDTITTNEQGIATTKELSAGTYYYKETKVPDGIVLNSEEVKFDLGYKLIEKEVINNYARGSLQIIKSDEYGNRLSGVTFEIYNANKEPIEKITTNEQGIATSSKLTLGTYYYKEVAAPDYVVKNEEMVEFKLNTNNQVVTQTVTNKVKKGVLEIKKVDEDGNVLSGVTFEILDKDNKVVDTVTTNEQGIATTKELDPGEYYYKETKVPDGIVLDTQTHKFTMQHETLKVEVKNYYAKGVLKIVKTDENGKLLEGVKFEIYDANNNLVDTIVTDENGEAVSKELRYGIYYYKEVEAPENVVMDTEMKKFEIKEDKQVVTVEVENKLVNGKLKVIKTTDDKQPLANVTFQILDENKEVIDEITTDENGIAISKDLKAGKYYYREKEAPVSVIPDYTEHEFVIGKEGQVIEVEVENKLVRGSLKIVKTDDNKTPLEGVKFEILNADKEVIEEIVTDESGIAVSGKLTVGKYYYREVEAPENVVMDTAEHEFKIMEEGQIIEVNVENKRIEGKLVITKLDKDSKAPIAGVTFQVLNEQKEVIATIVTDENGEARIGSLEKGKYYFKEIEAPEEYIMDNTEYDFEITKDMQTINKTVYNEHKKLPVTGGFISTNMLIVIIVAVVSIAGYVVITMIMKNKKQGQNK